MKKKIVLGVMVVFCIFMLIPEMAHSQTTIKKTRKLKIQKKRLPDLVVKFTAPNSVKAGEDIGPLIKLKVTNIGAAPAKGTATAGTKGYMVDLMLSTDGNVPASWAVYSPNFSEDVLLKGGRISNTITLLPGKSKYYPVGAGIPADTPPGIYRLCAKVDSGNAVAESNENNNSFCRRIRIIGDDKPKDNCRKKYPNPRIKFDRVDANKRVYIPVINWSSYDDEMFRKAPALPPCGANPNSARTWVDIYDAITGNRIYGFCALGTASDLTKIWFMAKTKYGRVYIIMKDRACKKEYRSNTISWKL